MKRTLATLVFLLVCSLLHGQDFNTMTGDWIRVKAEYKDGAKIPDNHGAHLLLRYYFTKKEVYQIYSENTLPCSYTRTGNVFKIAPVQMFAIETYTSKALTLVEADGPDPIRYYLIPTDSFQVSRRSRYSYQVVNNDTIYTNAPGIEPIYPKGENEFTFLIMNGFTEKVGFDFNYVVLKDGTIGDVVINASTNPTLNPRLIKLIKKTSGKWIPATLRGKPINVRQHEAIGLNNRR